MWIESKYLMSYKNIFFLSLVWSGLTNGENTQSMYPSIVWNPWNPLFACNEPKINVRIGDIVNFLCPSDAFSFFVPSSTTSLIYENLYFLGTNKEQYQACNATGMKLLLKCNDVKSDTKVYTVTFRDIRIDEKQIVFNQGETYYLIGTGFRVTKNLSSEINGSCRYTDDRGKYRLRLQIYVCKDDDVNCHICKSAGCYYKDCGMVTCTPWISDGNAYKNVHKQCFQVKTRTCTNPFIGANHSESRSFDEPCTEYQRMTENLSSKDSVIQGLGFGIVISFIVGLIIGVYVNKCHNNNREKMIVGNKSEPVTTTGAITAYHNNGFANSAISFGSFEAIPKDREERY